MHTHPNAQLTPLSRARLLRRHIDEHKSNAVLAAQVGMSLHTAYKWLHVTALVVHGTGGSN